MTMTATEPARATRYSMAEFAEFVDAYVEALFWVMDEDQPQPEVHDQWDALTRESQVEIIGDCKDFIEANIADLRAAGALGSYADRSGEWSAPMRAGHDFLLTRNGHGAGFWDRGLGEVGDRLADAARVYGSQSVWATETGMEPEGYFLLH